VTHEEHERTMINDQKYIYPMLSNKPIKSNTLCFVTVTFTASECQHYKHKCINIVLVDYTHSICYACREFVKFRLSNIKEGLSMGGSLTWRNLLGEIIEKSAERQRIATTLGVNPITLTRWVAGVSNPRPHKIQQLLDALPEHRRQLSRLIAQDFAGFFIDASEEICNNALPSAISSSFYSLIFTTYAQAPYAPRNSIIRDLIIKQIIPQIDPNNSSGIQAIIAQFVAPDEKEQPVQSLRVVAEQGTHPQTDFQTMFLGAESQIGLAILSNHIITVEDFLQEQQTLLFPERTIERSSLAYPILSAKGIAGGIAISSIQANYFTSSKLSLLQHYADLLTLSFDPDDFYSSEKIALGVMPTYEQQKTHLRSFETRVREILIQGAQNQQFMTRDAAEAVVWKKLEQELLKRNG
jgi:hypothetical protein